MRRVPPGPRLRDTDGDSDKEAGNIDTTSTRCPDTGESLEVPTSFRHDGHKRRYQFAICLYF